MLKRWKDVEHLESNSLEGSVAVIAKKMAFPGGFQSLGSFFLYEAAKLKKKKTTNIDFSSRHVLLSFFWLSVGDDHEGHGQSKKKQRKESGKHSIELVRQIVCIYIIIFLSCTI